MTPLSPAAVSGQSAGAARRAFVLLIGMEAVIALLPGAVASQELTALSELFAVKEISGGMGPYKWQGKEIYVRIPGKKPQYLGTIEGGPPGGMGPLSAASQHLRAPTMAISKDGRAVVFRQWAARGQSRLAPGIYRYVDGEGIKIIHKEEELSGQFYTSWEKPLPADVLPFLYKTTKTPKDLLWAVNTSGEEFPLALFEATPLHWAAFEGRTDDCAALIESGADVNSRTYWDFTPLDLAIIRDHQDTAIQLLALEADRNSGIYPAFHRAVMLARVKVVQAMLDRGADSNAADSHGYTPLHLAVFAGARLVGGMSPFFAYTETERSIMDRKATTLLVQMLLDKGADPGIRDKSGKTPLDVVSRFTPVEATELLAARSRAQ